MARIAGVELADNLNVDYALTNIKGIGWSLSKKILLKLKIDEHKKMAKLSADDLSHIASEVEKYLIEGELIRTVKANVARLKQIGSYRGSRHLRGLPVRGQRTRTNARTKRGKRKTIGAFKKETLGKQQQTENVKQK